MQWKEQRQRLRQSSRLKVALVILLFFFGVLFFGLLQKVPWQKIGSSEKHELVVPIPQSEPEVLLSDLLSQQNIKVLEGPRVTESALLVRLSDGARILFSSQKEIGQQVASLQIILGQLTIEGKKVASIDFRYDVPVITYEK